MKPGGGCSIADLTNHRSKRTKIRKKSTWIWSRIYKQHSRRVWNVTTWRCTLEENRLISRQSKVKYFPRFPKNGAELRRGNLLGHVWSLQVVWCQRLGEGNVPSVKREEKERRPRRWVDDLLGNLVGCFLAIWSVRGFALACRSRSFRTGKLLCWCPSVDQWRSALLLIYLWKIHACSPWIS